MGGQEIGKGGGGREGKEDGVARGQKEGGREGKGLRLLQYTRVKK